MRTKSLLRERRRSKTKENDPFNKAENRTNIFRWERDAREREKVENDCGDQGIWKFDGEEYCR
jgi:hypothetical protein